MLSLSIRARWATLDRNRIQRLAKEGGWIVVGQVASVLGMLVLVRMLTEYLSPAQYGELALGLTAAGLVNQVVLGGLNVGIGRFYSIAAEKNDLNGYLHASRQLLGYATAAVIAIATVLLIGLAWLGYSQWMGLAATALAFSVLSGYNASLSGIQNAARQRAIVAFHGGLDAWLKILLAMGVMFWLGSSSTAVVLGYALSSLLVTGSQLVLLKQAIPHAEPKESSSNWRKQIWAYSWSFSIFGFFTWLHLASDRWALQSFSSTEQVGLYAVVFQLGYMPIVMTMGMVSAFLGPILYQRTGAATNSARNNDVHRMSWRITQTCFTLTALVFVFTILLHEWIFKILVAAEYQSFSYLLPWMILAGGVFAAGELLGLKLIAELRPADMMTTKIVTSVFGISLNICGASLWGMKGVVTAQVVFSAVYYLWMALLARHPKPAFI